MEDKKKVIGLGILLSVLFLISASYAWLKVSVVSESNQVIHAGKLDLILDDEASDGIHMENLIPISDTKGREQEGYQFKLINRGTISSRYALYLDDLSLETGEERMKDSIVKYSLERDGVELSSGLLPEMGTNPNRVLDTGVINGKTTYTYVLRVWMDQDATIENQGTIFYTKIRAEAEQTNIPVKKSEMELTPESKERVPIKEGEDPRDYTYTSSDWNVVKVDEEGNIEVIGPGYAVITKTDQYGEKEEITVHVTVPVEATFETNDKIDSIGSIENNTCNLTENNQTTCQISLPEVEVKEGYEFVGWSTEENSHEGKKEKIEISPDKKILYPIVKIPGKTLTATFVKQGSGVESIGSESESCKIEDTYNNDTLETSCQITLPNMTVKEEYEAIGWNTNKAATEGITPDIININQDTKFYTIYKKKEVNLTATFVLNGAKSLNGLDADQLENGKLTLTCTVPESYSGETETNSCEVTTPTIEASDATPNIIGFNEDKNATEPSISNKVAISENKTYYALTKSETKTLTATFYRNGAKSLGNDTNETVTKQCNMEITYNGTPQEACSIEVPNIEASDNTPTVLGYSKISAHEGDIEYLKPGKEISIKENVSYYAQTANAEDIAYNVTYQKGSHVISVEKESDACTIPPSYNGEPRATSCMVTAPDYTVDEGYKKVGYSESRDAKDGITNITLTKDTTYYANAKAMTITVGYYHNGEKVGTSNAKVGETITLTSFEDLNITKAGYHFKGWDTKEEATDVIYSDEATISDLTEGETRELYAVWVDDIAPVCTLTLPDGNYTVDDNLTATLTCTDEGSGLYDMTGRQYYLESSHYNNFVDGSTYIDDLKLSTNQDCEYQEHSITCSIDIEAFCTSTNATMKFPANALTDKAGNKNEEAISNNIKINGKTFTATLSKEGVSGVSELKSTSQSCTTTGTSRQCYVNIGKSEIEPKGGYRFFGWGSTPDEDRENVHSGWYLSKNETYYPILDFAFVAAYTYDETKINTEKSTDNSRVCVTGEEETCAETNCYFDKTADACPMGTIIKYYVDNSYNTPRYFHVMYDNGSTMLLQERGNTLDGNWLVSDKDLSPKDVGPSNAIEQLEKATKNWDYVNTQIYTMGTTPFGSQNNYYTSCNIVDTSGVSECLANSYTLEEKREKARMMTVQEAVDTSCTSKINDHKCPIWMFNYLNSSISLGGTQTGGTADYWLMNTPGISQDSWRAHGAFMNGDRIAVGTAYTPRGIRAVVEITKYDR